MKLNLDYKKNSCDLAGKGREGKNLVWIKRQIVKIIDDDDMRVLYALLFAFCLRISVIHGAFPRVSKSSLPLICPVNALNCLR